MGIFDKIRSLFEADHKEKGSGPQEVGDTLVEGSGEADEPALSDVPDVPGWPGPTTGDPELIAIVGRCIARAAADRLDAESFDEPSFGADLDLLVERGALTDVIEILRRAALHLPDHPPLLLRLARAYTDRYDNEAARTLWLRLAEMGHWAAEANFTLGELAVRDTDLASAAAYYQRALAFDVDYPNAWKRASTYKEHLPMPSRRAAATVGGVGAGLEDNAGLGIRPPDGFELRHPLGRGGYGTVYLARDMRLHRDVAVKFLHPHLTRDRRRVEAFFAEARLVSHLALPGIVRIYDIDSEERLIVMEYLTRGTLRDRLASGRPLAPKAALAVVLALLRTLAQVHRDGLVHRDIKPGNILFRSDGTTVLGDFGVATFEEGLLETRQAGTLAYMAPEQRKGGADADRRMDLYAVGLVLTEMLAGALPPRPAGKPVRPETYLALLPRAVRTILEPTLLRLLSIDPAGRHSDARQVVAELDNARRKLLARDRGPELLDELERLLALGGDTAASRAYLDRVRSELASR